MNANVGLAIQCVGIVLVVLLSFSMRGTIKSSALTYWTSAWVCLALSLTSLVIAFHTVPGHRLFYSLYFFGEYTFGLLFIAGCRFIANGAVARGVYALFLPALIVAVLVPFVSADFNDLFMMHSTIMAVMFGASFFALRPAFSRDKTSPGVRVMMAALFLLTIDFLHYVPVFGARKGLWGLTVPALYLRYTSIVDLILEIVLGFGTMMVLLEGVRREVEAANHQLTTARDKLELMASMDPLTEALNRHAFHSLLSRNESNSESEIDGCVAVIDIDNLKPINDQFGHSVGDKAIRSVARAVRSLIRADDMLFRWGGDEFLVLMFKLRTDEAARRMNSLNEILELHGKQWMSSVVTISVSHGVAGFESLDQLADAIERADRLMYDNRQLTRAAHKSHETSETVPTT